MPGKFMLAADLLLIEAETQIRLRVYVARAFQILTLLVIAGERGGTHLISHKKPIDAPEPLIYYLVNTEKEVIK